MAPETETALRIAAAALGGAAIGVERQWSGHASGPHAHFGGVRTFTLLGGLAGIAGWLWSSGAGALPAVLLGGAAALVVAAYVAVSRRDVDGTAEVAALVVLAAGWWQAAPGTTSAPQEERNPLAVGAALQLAALFQAVLFAVHAVRSHFGDLGLVASGALLGLTDVDALVIAMTRSAARGAQLVPMAQAIALGVLANGTLKLLLALVLGARDFRRRAGIDLALPLAAGATVLGLVAS